MCGYSELVLARVHTCALLPSVPGNPVLQPQPAPKAERNVVYLMPRRRGKAGTSRALSFPLASRPCRRSAGWVLFPGIREISSIVHTPGAPIRRIVGRLAILVLGTVRAGPAPPGVHP